MEYSEIFGVVFIIGVAVVNTGEYCSSYADDIWSTTRTMWCSDDCCGDMYSRICCLHNAFVTIVGIVIGAICGVILLVSVIVAIYCCCRKSRGQASDTTRSTNRVWRS